MAINKKLIHFKKFSDFNSKKLSANEANTQYTVGVGGTIQNGTPDVLYQSICWIKDTKQQWTHGQVYDFSDSDIYYTDFTADDVWLVYQGEGGNPIDVTQELLDAINDNKIIIVPAGSTRSGYNMLYGKTDTETAYRLAFVGADQTIVYDMDYRNLSVGHRIDLASDAYNTNVSFLRSSDYAEPNVLVQRGNDSSIDVLTLKDFTTGETWGLHSSSGAAHIVQEKLVSGENIKKIGGRSIVGQGNITFKTINGENIIGSGDITIEGGGGDDIRYFTEFTVSEFAIACNDESSITSEGLFDAIMSNKIICIPYSHIDGNKGYIIASANYSYGNFTDSHSFTITMENGSTLFGASNDTQDLGSNTLWGYSTESGVVSIAYLDADSLSGGYKDNMIYVITSPVNEFVVAGDFTKGSTFRFKTGDNPTLVFLIDVLWANGVMPEIEPNTYYELSIVLTVDYYFAAVLTPFKPVE